MLEKLARKEYQTIYTDVERGIIGNCIAACLASMLDLDIASLPHERRLDLYRSFLAERGWIVDLVAGYPPRDGLFYITSYNVSSKVSKSGLGHVVIWRNGRIVHDPRRDRVRLVKATCHYPLRKVGRFRAQWILGMLGAGYCEAGIPISCRGKVITISDRLTSCWVDYAHGRQLKAALSTSKVRGAGLSEGDQFWWSPYTQDLKPRRKLLAETRRRYGITD